MTSLLLHMAAARLETYSQRQVTIGIASWQMSPVLWSARPHLSPPQISTSRHSRTVLGQAAGASRAGPRWLASFLSPRTHPRARLLGVSGVRLSPLRFARLPDAEANSHFLSIGKSWVELIVDCRRQSRLGQDSGLRGAARPPARAGGVLHMHGRRGGRQIQALRPRRLLGVRGKPQAHSSLGGESPFCPPDHIALLNTPWCEVTLPHLACSTALLQSEAEMQALCKSLGTCCICRPDSGLLQAGSGVQCPFCRQYVEGYSSMTGQAT